MTKMPEAGGLAAEDWYACLPEPLLASSSDGERRLNLRRYIGTPPRMEQPALLENLLCLHLGGPKQVRRWRHGRMSVYDIELGALTLLPAEQSNSWLTQGPVDFGLIALDPALFRQAAMEEFDLEASGLVLQDTVGFRSPGIERLFRALLASAGRTGAAGRLYPESLTVVLTVALLRDHSAMTMGGPARLATVAQKGGLAARRLRRVIDYMTEHLAADIGLAELTDQAGLSRAQFFRTFKQATGLTPHRYLADLRLEKARSLLDDARLCLGEVGAAVGLGPERRFSAAFRLRYGVTPQRYRRALR